MPLNSYSPEAYEKAFQQIDAYREAYQKSPKSIGANKQTTPRTLWLEKQLDAWFDMKKESQEVLRPIYEALRTRIDSFVKLEERGGVKANHRDSAFWEIFFDSLAVELKQDSEVLSLQNESSLMAKMVLSQPRAYELMQLYPDATRSMIKNAYLLGPGNPEKRLQKASRNTPTSSARLNSDSDNVKQELPDIGTKNQHFNTREKRHFSTEVSQMRSRFPNTDIEVIRYICAKYPQNPEEAMKRYFKEFWRLTNPKLHLVDGSNVEVVRYLSIYHLDNIEAAFQEYLGIIQNFPPNLRDHCKTAVETFCYFRWDKEGKKETYKTFLMRMVRAIEFFPEHTLSIIEIFSMFTKNIFQATESLISMVRTRKREGVDTKKHDYHSPFMDEKVAV